LTNEIDSRARNEWIQAIPTSVEEMASMRDFVCECSDRDCPHPLDLGTEGFTAWGR
jgi:hypothetical protein